MTLYLDEDYFDTEEEHDVEDSVEEKTEDGEPWENLQAGDEVMHKSFGRGEVVDIDEKYVIVRFSDREAKFLFPVTFEKGYLSC